MAVYRTTFSITVRSSGRSLPDWYPEWVAPGVITAIPNSSFAAAIAANGWTDDDPVGGGTPWPRGLYSFSGGTMAYLNGQPYHVFAGGGHATTADNSVYAFGPLFGPGADAPTWSRIGAQSATEDLLTCTQHNADGRPTSRHTAGDFSYGVGSDGKGRIVMLWQNSAYCKDGGAQPIIDVFDLEELEWDNAKTPPIAHPEHSLIPMAHSASAFHPPTGLWFAKGKGARSDSFGSYDPVTQNFVPIRFSGKGMRYDSMMTWMGNRPYLYFCKDEGETAGRLHVETGISESWGDVGFPNGLSRTVGYDSLQDRLYLPVTGIVPSSEPDGNPPGLNDVAWLDASANTNPSWNRETFSGDTPDQQRRGGTFGRWCFVPELKGFILHNHPDSPLYFYRTSE